MTNRKSWVKTWLQNLGLCMISLIFILLIGEWLFPKFLNKVPFRLYGGVDNNLRVLAQYSKKSVIPRDYIAIFGDSNSVGVGDLYIDLTKDNGNWYPDYAPAHFLHKKLETDVVSFGFAGAGSFDGIWSGPVKQFEYIRSKGFDLKPPKTILIFFYEGNDISNNLRFVLEKYNEIEDIETLVQSKNFNGWLDIKFLESVMENHSGFIKSFVFGNFIINLVRNTYKENIEKHQDKRRILFPATPLTQAVINGDIVPLPMHLQAPPVFNDGEIGVNRVTFFEKKIEFSDEKLMVGYYILEKSIEKLRNYFSDSRIKIIYQPSVLSSYEIVSSSASFLTNLGDAGNLDPRKLYRGGLVDSKKLVQRHLEVCRRILKISQKLNISFFDTTGYLRKASSEGYIHGPKDWDHLNESGYRALSDSISEFLLHPNEHYESCAN